MSLPEVIQVKLSSEAAESISITPVVVREIPVRELIEYMLGVAGKDEARVRELLLRGSLVSGASRFRWKGWEADLESIRSMLASFPDPQPERPFAGRHCVRVVLRGGRQPIEISRQAGSRKSWLRRTSFWDLLMEVAAAAEPTYAGYSYKDRADFYHMPLGLNEAEKLRAGSRILKYTVLRDQVGRLAFSSAELFVERSS